MRFAARTDPGRREGENEDSVGSDESNRLWLVADGMGGHASGRVASRIVCEKLLELAGSPSLEQAVMEAHAVLRRTAESDPQLSGMGSTVVAAHISDGICHVVWVGDSRAYLWRGGNLFRLTRDHSWQELMRTVPNAAPEPDVGQGSRIGITQALGHGEPQPASVDVQLRSGDRILLASDGLTSEVEDDEIAGILAQSADAGSATDALVAAALTKGGRDNVSTIVVDFETGDDLQLAPAAARGGQPGIVMAILSGVALAVAAVALWRYFRMRL